MATATKQPAATDRRIPAFYQEVEGMDAVELLQRYRAMVEAKVLRQVAQNMGLQPVDRYDRGKDAVLERELKIRLGID